MTPVSRVLVVSDDAKWQSDVLAGLGAVAVRLENPYGLTFIGASRLKEAMDIIRRDGDIQAVLVDKQLQEKALNQAAVALANQISDFRPELSLYVLLMDDDERVMVENLASHAVDGYFYRDETDYNGWFRILTAELA